MLIGQVPALLTRDWSNTAAMLGCSGIECGADFGASLGAVHNSGQATLSGIYNLFILCTLGRFAEGVWGYKSASGSFLQVLHLAYS